MRKRLRKTVVSIIFFAVVFANHPLGAFAATTRWDGRVTLQSGRTYYINEAIHITSDVNVPENAAITINTGGKLTVSEGRKLTSDGNIIVGKGGELDVNGELEIGIHGTLAVQGTALIAKSGGITSYGDFTVETGGGVVNEGVVILGGGSAYTKDGVFVSASGSTFRDSRGEAPPDSEPEPEPEPEPVFPFEKMTAELLKNEPRVEIPGIDVSRWQEEIDWARVKRAGVEFVIIRAGRGHHSDAHPMAEDVRFRENIEGALKNGIDVGVYFYSYARTPEEAVREAEFYMDLIKDYKITYPVVLDIEEPFHQRMSVELLSEITEAFLAVIMENGYYPMLYSNKTFLENNFNRRIVDTYAIWLALWSTTLTYDGAYYIWQYTATGRVDGIEGDVDLNISYINFPEVLRRHGLNRLG